MELDLLDKSIFDVINARARTLEDLFSADVVFYDGLIQPANFRHFRDFIEKVANTSDRKDGAIAVFLRTAGGSVETAESMVIALRKHYERVYFVVPDFAMSAGTILCMSGDKIYMDYASSLGPIDPQVPSRDGDDYVPALGYLDKVKEITDKGDLDPADVVLLQNLDIGKLAFYEQAQDLSRTLLKKWLVVYKFKDWTVHRTTNPGTAVTLDEKEELAETVAIALGDHNRWHSHGRRLNVTALQALKLEIDDYSDMDDMRDAIRLYNDSLTGYIDQMGIELFLHHQHLKLWR